VEGAPTTMAHCSQVPSMASLCLLGFIATFKLMEVVLRHGHAHMKSPNIVEYLADTLKISGSENWVTDHGYQLQQNVEGEDQTEIQYLRMSGEALPWNLHYNNDIQVSEINISFP
jgi:hypothetical protein